MTIQEAFEKLEQKYGNHSAAATALGYTPEHYRAIRNGRSPVPERVQNSIIAIARVSENSPEPPNESARNLNSAI